MRDDRSTGQELVGRASELAHIDALWTAGHRLITLLGPGGIGKTRLALELARGSEERAVVLCELTRADSRARLVAAVARALGMRPSTAAEPAGVDAIGRRLARGEQILVLDELERLVDCAAETIRPWLALAPELRILVTSRRALGLSEETLLELGPLTLEDGARLFVQRARRRSPQWSPDSDDARAISALVQRVDGMPLAINLCAARAAVIAPRELLSLLDAHVDVLGAGPDDPVSTHRSLAAALDGSWKLLSAGEQAALAALSVFRGGFTLEAAAALLDAPARALDTLQALRHSSLLRRVAPAQPGAPSRYAMYETIRAYAAARLDERGTRAPCEDRLAAYYGGLGERHARDGSLGALRDDWENLCFAAEHLLPREPIAAARLLVCLHEELIARERRERHAALLTRAVAGVRAVEEPSLLAETLTRLAELYRLCGDLDGAGRAADEAVQLAAGAADDRVLANALRARGELGRIRGDLDEAADALAESRAAAVRAGDRRAEADARMALLNLQFVRRRMDCVANEGKAAYAIWVELGDLANQALALSARGLALLETGQYAAAQPVLEESLEVYRRAAHPRGEGRVLVALAELACQQGRYDAAHALATRAVTLLEFLGASPWLEMALAVLGLIELSRGRVDDALGYVRQAERAMGSGGYVRIRVFVLGCRSLVEAARRGVSRAEAALDTARDLAAELEPVIRRFVDACAGVVEAQAARAQSDGQPERARALLARARGRLRDLEESGQSASSLDVRMVEGLLRDALARAATGAEPAAASTAEPAPDASGLRVAGDGAWFATADDGRVVVQRRAWRRVLVALATHRIEQPGHGLSTDELFSAGWPGERAVRHAARNRVWVALSALRRQGLDAQLVRREGRYLIDPHVATQLASNPTEDRAGQT